MKTILVTGYCGSGKTWVMQQLLKEPYVTIKLGLVYLNITDKYAIPGVYSNHLYDGSDRLSMAVSKDFYLMYEWLFKNDVTLICEGQRFMNKKFRELFNPKIIRILDDGSMGREHRHSAQSERHLKSIITAVNNIKPDYQVANSENCYNLIKELLT